MMRSEYDRLAAQGESAPTVEPPSGRWLKVCFGVLVGLVLLGVFGFIVLHLLAREVANAPTSSCLSHLRSIHGAALCWAEEHHTSQLPTDFALFSAQLGDPKLLRCPWDDTHTNLSAWSSLSSNISYVLMSSGAAVDGTDAYVVCTFHHYAIMGNGELSHDRSGKPHRVPP